MTEQQQQENFVDLVGGYQRADRLMQIWRDYRNDRERAFKAAAKREDYTNAEVCAFLALD